MRTGRITLLLLMALGLLSSARLLEADPPTRTARPARYPLFDPGLSARPTPPPPAAQQQQNLPARVAPTVPIRLPRVDEAASHGPRAGQSAMPPNAALAGTHVARGKGRLTSRQYDATSDAQPFSGPALPDGHSDPRVWWSGEIALPQRGDNPTLPITLEQLAVETLRHSQQIQALRVLPQIRETQIVQAEAEFDPELFIENRWYDRDEPVGNFLTTGGIPRLLEETQTNNAGIRRKTQTGASVEVGQQLILQDSNSTFFTPNDQAQTRLVISVQQPLLRDRGVPFNRSLIVLAQFDTRVAWDEFVVGLQDHLLEVSRQYWNLYLQRALVLQKQRNLSRARAIQAELESRERIDAIRSQIARAKAKVATREADLVRAQAGVRNAESVLRSLVNSPALCSIPGLEVLPADTPAETTLPLDFRVAKQLALENRAEIDNLLTQIKSASVRTSIAKNQLMPSLALILEGYVNGLSGNFNAATSFGNQFSEGAPSYTAGLAFETPLGRRRAKAQLKQRQLEMMQLYRQLDAATAELAAEVEIALREVEVAHAEFRSRLESLAATRTEVDYLEQRWRHLPGDEQSTSFLLEDLLDAEDRLVDEEQLVATAQVRQAIAYAELKRALGTLVTGASLSTSPPPAEVPPSPPENVPPPQQSTSAAGTGLERTAGDLFARPPLR